MTLKCKQCGYENEGERVYCHNCGVKLDRSVLPPGPSKEASAEEVRKRVRKYADPGRFRVSSVIKSLLSVLLWAVLAAAVLEVIQAPDHVPPMPESKLIDAPAISLALEDAIQDPNGRSLAYDEAQINAFLYNTLRSKGTEDLVQYQRSFVRIEPGTLWITTQRALWGYSFYASKAVALEMQTDGLVAQTRGGALGRLPIHPSLMEYFDAPFASLWENLSRERKLLDKLQAVTVGPDHVVLQTGARRAR